MCLGVEQRAPVTEGEERGFSLPLRPKLIMFERVPTPASSLLLLPVYPRCSDPGSPLPIASRPLPPLSPLILGGFCPPFPLPPPSPPVLPQPVMSTSGQRWGGSSEALPVRHICWRSALLRNVGRRIPGRECCEQRNSIQLLSMTGIFQKK